MLMSLNAATPDVLVSLRDVIKLTIVVTTLMN